MDGLSPTSIKQSLCHFKTGRKDAGSAVLPVPGAVSVAQEGRG
jgi:hypothetical protein